MANSDVFTYKYTAVHPTDVDAEGRRVFVNGTMQAASEDIVRATLVNERGLEPVAILNKKQFGGTEWSFAKLFGKPSTKAMATTYRQLASLVNNNVPLPEAIAAVAEGSPELMVRETFAELRDRVTQGYPLDQAMAEFPKVFDDVTIQLVRAATTGSGEVGQTLERVAVMTENKNAIKKKIRGALMMPVFTITAAFGAGILMSVMLVPQMARMLDTVNPDASLPWATALLMWFSAHAIIIIPVFVFLIVGFYFLNRMVLNKKPEWLRFKSQVMLKTPVFGRLTRLQGLATLSRGMDMMLNAGVLQSEALVILAPTMKNVLYRESVEALANAVVEGRRLSEVMVSHPKLYSFTYIKMVQAGEKAGNLNEMMDNIATETESDVKDMTDSMAELLNPLAMVVVGAMLAILGLAMFGPIISIASNV